MLLTTPDAVYNLKKKYQCSFVVEVPTIGRPKLDNWFNKGFFSKGCNFKQHSISFLLQNVCHWLEDHLNHRELV